MRVGHADWSDKIWLGLFLGAALFLGACAGDDNTTEAKIEKAKIALDKGDYTTAVSTLQGLCGVNLAAPTCNSELISLYASAFSGRAGLDVFALMEEAATKTVAANSSYALFSTHFSNPTAGDAGDMNSAVTLLVSIPVRTPAQGLQLALVSTSDLVVSLG